MSLMTSWYHPRASIFHYFAKRLHGFLGSLTCVVLLGPSVGHIKLVSGCLTGGRVAAEDKVVVWQM